MLKSILKLNGAKELSREEEATVKGANLQSNCKSEGEPCSLWDNAADEAECFAGEQQLYCIDGVWRPQDYRWEENF